MASDRGVPGVYGDFPPSYALSQPPANPELLRRINYCHAAFALKQISKVTRSRFFSVLMKRFCFGGCRESRARRELPVWGSWGSGDVGSVTDSPLVL